MLTEIYYSIYYTQTTLSGLVAAVALYRLRKRPFAVRMIGLLFLLGFVANTTAFFLTGNDVNIPGHVYDVFLIILISAIYNNSRKGYYKGFNLLVVIAVALAIANLLFVQKFNIVTTYNKPLSSLLIIIYTLVFFYRLIIELPTTQVYKMPMFWFNSAFLIFHSGAFFLYVFASYIVGILKNNLIVYWSFHNFLSIVMHFIIMIGLFYDLKSLKVRSLGVY